MTSKERAELKAQAIKLDSIFQIGKSSLTPQMVAAVKDALRARELIKVSVLKNCMDDPRELAEILSGRTGSEVVQVIGKKIVLYKKNYELEEKRKRKKKQEKQTKQKQMKQKRIQQAKQQTKQKQAKQAQQKQVKWSGER